MMDDWNKALDQKIKEDAASVRNSFKNKDFSELNNMAKDIASEISSSSKELVCLLSAAYAQHKELGKGFMQIAFMGMLTSILETPDEVLGLLEEMRRQVVLIDKKSTEM